MSRIVCVFVLCLVSGHSQEQAPAPKVYDRTSGGFRALPRFLTVKQKLARDILDSADASAGSFEPVTHSYICYQAARGVQKYDRARAQGLLRRCLLSSQAIEDDQKQLREQIQSWIITQLLEYGPEGVEEYLPQLQGAARQRIRSRLIDGYSAKGKFEKAIELAQGARPEDEPFPWQSAANLMQWMPEDMASERQALFQHALLHYRNRPPKPGQAMFEDLGTLVVRFGTVVSKPLALEAIDELLKTARQGDAERSDKISFTLRGREQTAIFYGMYEYRLFQVLPVLREIDPSRAESLLKENQQAKDLLVRLPDGLRSIDPNSFNATAPEDDTKRELSISIRGGTAGVDENEQARYRLRIAQEQAVELASKSPKQAIARALSLPPSGVVGETPRASALIGIARALQERNTGSAKDALLEVPKALSDVYYQNAMGRLSEAAGLLINIDETEAAAALIKAGMELGKQRFVADTDAGNPNIAPRVFWPSAGVWRSFVLKAGKISPQSGLEAIKEIPDAEIQLACQVALANSWLDVPAGELLIRDVRKNGDDDWSQFDDREQ